MTRKGRPLRAIGAVVSSWVAARIIVLASAIAGPVDLVMPVMDAAGAGPPPLQIAEFSSAKPQLRIALDAVVAPMPDRYTAAHGTDPTPPLLRGPVLRIALAPPVEPGTVHVAQAPPDPPFALRDKRRTSFSRPSVAIWLVWRGASGAALASGGQLGGSQIGARALVPVGQVRATSRIALSGRISSPLSQMNGKEAALGLFVRQEGQIPLELGIERRFALDPGGRDAMALVGSTGIYDYALGGGFRLDGYAQAGVVGFRRRDLFADGALLIERPVFGDDRHSLRLGAGVWGAAQPGLSRLDIGPVATARSGNIRVTGAWRVRVAGRAAPASGPALTIGADF